MTDANDLRCRIEAALMHHAKADDELQAKIADKAGGRIVFSMEELADVPDLEALLLDCLPFLSAPAVPDDVAEVLKRLRDPNVFGTQTAIRAAATIEAQAAELARLRTLADALVSHPGWGTVNYTDGDMWADADKLRAAITHPTGERSDD